MPTFDTPAPISVTLDVAVGEVRIIAGERTQTVVELRPSDPDRRADVTASEQTGVHFADGTLVVRTPPSRSWRRTPGSVDLELSLPTGSQVTATTAMAAVSSTGRLGDTRVKSAAGDIVVEHGHAVKVDTAAGDITVRKASGDAELTTSAGHVSIDDVDGAGQIKSSNGDLRVGRVGGECRCKTANGDIAIGQAGASITAKTANGDVRLGAVQGGAVVAETGYGDVDIAVADGLPAWLDLHTHYGRLDNRLETAEPPQSPDALRIRARTGFGDITIRRCAASGAESALIPR